jgi:enamine deaminase RidA (YjgF/YER057c/UK114 family)
MHHDARFNALGLTLPPVTLPAGTYETYVEHVVTGEQHETRLAYTSGHGPMRADGSFVIGKLGATLDVAAGREAARLTGLGIIATVRDRLGTLDRVVRVIKILGFVNATPEFTDHPKVIDGFSDLMRDVFGNAGIAARSAVGAPSLPRGIAVEIEAIFAIR